MPTKYTTNIPNLIEKLLIDLQENTHEIAVHKTAYEVREAEIFEEICSRRDEAGKPVFGNDTTRQNALVLAKSKDADLGLRSLYVASAESVRAKMQAEIEALKMNFKIHLLDRELEIALATK